MDKELLPDLVFVKIPSDSEPSSPRNGHLFLPSDRYVDGCQIVLLSLTPPGKGLINLTSEFLSACDPDISFDAKTILFAGKKDMGEPWHIWRMDRDGSNKVQISKGLHDCVAPIHVGARFFLNDPAPADQIVYASANHGGVNEYGRGPAYSLYASDLEGNNIHRITFNLSADFSPDVLPNGRVVFSSWQRYGSRFAPTGIYSLMGVNIDGTDLMPFYSNHEKPLFKEMARVSTDERVYFIESDRSSWLGGGNLSFVSHRRPLHSHEVLSHIDGGLFHSPCPLPNGELLASYRSELPGSYFSIYRISPETGKRLTVVYEEDSWHSVYAHVLTPHPRVQGRSNWLVPGVETGVFYCLNCYRTNLREGNKIAPGSIKHLRVIEGLPIKQELQVSGTHFRPSRILGVIPVEADGSFHIKVPAKIPITFQLLDENKMALQTQQSWIWVMGNESRGCIGCHEDREMSPPNRMVDAVIKPAVKLTLPAERRRTVDFRNQIVPIIERKCSIKGCHSEGVVAPNLDVNQLTEPLYSQVYEILLSDYVNPGNAKESPLIQYLFEKRMGSLMPHERILFIEWIDLGAVWDS